MCEVVAMVNRRDSHRAWTGGGGVWLGVVYDAIVARMTLQCKQSHCCQWSRWGERTLETECPHTEGRLVERKEERSKPDSVFLQERKGKVKIPVSEEGNELVVPFAWFGCYHVIARFSLTPYIRHLTQQPADVGGPAGEIPFGRYKRAWKADDAILPASTSPVTLSSANSALRQPHT